MKSLPVISLHIQILHQPQIHNIRHQHKLPRQKNLHLSPRTHQVLFLTRRCSAIYPFPIQQWVQNLFESLPYIVLEQLFLAPVLEALCAVLFIDCVEEVVLAGPATDGGEEDAKDDVALE